MNPTPRIRLLRFGCGLLILVGLTGLGARFHRHSDAADGKESKLNQLLNQKLEILQNVVAQMEKLHDQGEAGFEELYEAHLAMHRAQMDLCQTDQERIAVLEELLGEAKRRETAVKAAGVASSRRIRKAEVDRLDIEILLERIKSK